MAHEYGRFAILQSRFRECTQWLKNLDIDEHPRATWLTKAYVDDFVLNLDAHAEIPAIFNTNRLIKIYQFVGTLYKDMVNCRSTRHMPANVPFSHEDIVAAAPDNPRQVSELNPHFAALYTCPIDSPDYFPVCHMINRILWAVTRHFLKCRTLSRTDEWLLFKAVEGHGLLQVELRLEQPPHVNDMREFYRL